jgi:hypothetical protein
MLEERTEERDDVQTHWRKAYAHHLFPNRKKRHCGGAPAALLFSVSEKLACSWPVKEDVAVVERNCVPLFEAFSFTVPQKRFLKISSRD